MWNENDFICFELFAAFDHPGIILLYLQMALGVQRPFVPRREHAAAQLARPGQLLLVALRNVERRNRRCDTAHHRVMADGLLQMVVHDVRHIKTAGVEHRGRRRCCRHTLTYGRLVVFVVLLLFLYVRHGGVVVEPFAQRRNIRGCDMLEFVHMDDQFVAARKRFAADLLVCI